MNNQEIIINVFKKYNPRLEIAEGTKDSTKLQLFDCDEYKLGVLIFYNVEMICLTTWKEFYSNIEFYNKGNLPIWLSFVHKAVSENDLIIVFRNDLFYAGDDESLLPIFENVRIGYVICKSFVFIQDGNV